MVVDSEDIFEDVGKYVPPEVSEASNSKKAEVRGRQAGRQAVLGDSNVARWGLLMWRCVGCGWGWSCSERRCREGLLQRASSGQGRRGGGREGEGGQGERDGG